MPVPRLIELTKKNDLSNIKLQTMKTLISIGLTALLLCCQKKEVAMSDFEKLCSYKGKTTDAQSEPCKSSEFIVQLKDINGSIAYVDDLKSYCIISKLENTYDCQFIGILCGDYKDVLKKDISFSAKFNYYNGDYRPPIGGQSVYVISDFIYSLK
jgi:hypothetical protein